MNPFEGWHERRVFPRRVRVLASRIAPLLPDRAAVLDLGAGDGALAAEILRRRPDLSVRGMDVAARPASAIPVETFDGRRIPAADGGFDAVLLVDVVHHADAPEALLVEAARVARRCVIVKDHLREGFLAGPTLTLMDRVGNARHGVPVPGRYWTRREWDDAFARTGLRVEERLDRLGLYPAPLSVLFERSLHFLARLAPARTTA